MGEQVKEIDLLLAERRELGDQFGDRRVQLEQAALDQRQREHIGELLRHRHRGEHRIGLQRLVRRALGIAFGQIEHHLAMARHFHAHTVAAAGIDISLDGVADTAEALGVETESGEMGCWCFRGGFLR